MLTETELYTFGLLVAVLVAWIFLGWIAWPVFRDWRVRRRMLARYAPRPRRRHLP